MLFRRNKIKQGIENSNNDSISSEIENEFELLTKIKRKQKERNILNLIFVYPFVSIKKNVIEKSCLLGNYFKNNYVKIYTFLLVLLSLITLAIGLWMIFSPFPIVSNGDYAVPISNFYLGTNGHVSGITPIGIVFLIMTILILGFFIFYVIKVKHFKKLFVRISKTTFILSIVNWVLLFAAIIFLLVLIFIVPPTIVSQNYQQITNLIVQIDNTNDNSLKLKLIGDLAKLTQDPKYNLTPLNNISIEGFNQWKQDSNWYNNFQTDINGIIYSGSIGSFFYELNISGKLIVSFITILFATSIIVIPFIMFCIISLDYIKTENEEKLDNWSSYRVFFFNLINRIKSMFIWLKNKFKKNDSFHKYKKRVKNKGILQKEATNEFTTDVNKTSVVKQTITKEEIEMNPPNIAFLSKEGKWMYHDGKGNYFIAKDDQWHPYDIEQVIHRAHANIVDTSLDFTPSNKKAKEEKFNLIKNRKESAIALPDEEIDRIARDLNI